MDKKKALVAIGSIASASFVGYKLYKKHCKKNIELYTEEEIDMSDIDEDDIDVEKELEKEDKEEAVYTIHVKDDDGTGVTTLTSGTVDIKEDISDKLNASIDNLRDTMLNIEQHSADILARIYKDVSELKKEKNDKSNEE